MIVSIFFCNIVENFHNEFCFFLFSHFVIFMGKGHDVLYKRMLFYARLLLSFSPLLSLSLSLSHTHTHT